jgi:hypothetical protein
LFSYARLANDTAIILKIPLRKIVILIISEERGLVQRFPRCYISFTIVV